MNKLFLCLLVAMCVGCGPSEKPDTSDPDSVIVDPYKDSSLARPDKKTPAEAEAEKRASYKAK